MSKMLKCPNCGSCNLVAGYTFTGSVEDNTLMEAINKQIEKDNEEHPEWEPYKPYERHALISVEQINGHWDLLPFTLDDGKPMETREPNSTDIQCRTCGRTFPNPRLG